MTATNMDVMGSGESAARAVLVTSAQRAGIRVGRTASDRGLRSTRMVGRTVRGCGGLGSWEENPIEATRLMTTAMSPTDVKMTWGKQSDLNRIPSFWQWMAKIHLLADSVQALVTRRSQSAKIWSCSRLHGRDRAPWQRCPPVWRWPPGRRLMVPCGGHR